ncbi:MAG: PKD domain-containing protein [bacterium]|nr:PKD domain-containing protein [bacterium]
MPPTSKWGQWETVPAEVLPSGWQRSVDIDDLRALFPVMERLSGWYTIEAELPYSRYGWTVSEAGSGRLLGVMDNKASHGTLKSKKMRIFVAPARGGRMKIRVEDLGTPEQTARSNVEIRIFRRNDLQDKSLADAWATLDSITRGNTGLGGWVTLPPGGSCLPEPFLDDAYVAIAKYKGEYKEAYIENGAEGWQTECGGLLTRYILFGQVPQEFSVFGLDSVWIRNNARIESGHVGAQAQCASCTVPGFEVAIQDGWVADGYQIKGNRVQISGSVWDILCNSYDNQGMIRGEITQPLDLPLWDGLQELFPSQFTPGNESHTVGSHASLTLTEGEYRDLTVGSHAILYLEGGEYHFRDMSLGSHARVVCLGPVDIRIKGRLGSGSAKAAYLGPGANTDIGPEDVVVYVQGTGGVLFGQGHNILANIYARNGTFETGEGCVLTGSFIARDVTIGQKTVVNYAGAFSQGGEPPTPNMSPTARFSADTDSGEAPLQVSFDASASSDPDGSIVSYFWVFGDGSTGTGVTISHTFDSPGTFTVTLTVADDAGASDMDTKDIIVSGGSVEITLTAAFRKQGSKYYVDLAWSGATSGNVDINRNDSLMVTTPNDGSYTDRLGKNPVWPYTYQVCEPNTDICSNEANVLAP